MNKWKSTLPILISLFIAIGGSVFIYRWMDSKTAPKDMVEVQNIKAVPVVVAAMDLSWGTIITAEMLKTLPYLRESLPTGHFTVLGQLQGRVLVANLKQGDAVVEHRLAPIDIKTGGVSAVLGPGKRAIAVKGNKIIGISGFINPGNHVDILVTMRDPYNRHDRTKIVLENIPVLATGTQIDKNDKGEPAPVDVYTLEVTPLQCEKLTLAAAKGKLQFALRNITDSEQVRTHGATISKTLRSLTPVAKSGYRGSNSTTVEVIKGSQKSKQKVRL